MPTAKGTYQRVVLVEEVTRESPLEHRLELSSPSPDIPVMS